MQRYEQASEFQEKMVAVNRVTKVVKGGRNFRFAALMVVGDGAGRIGTGIGKATEIPEAIRKGVDDAKKHLITVPLQGTTLPHETVGLFGTTKIVLMPAPEGTGVIAGGAVRAVLELVGVKDIRTKSYGSNNPINMVKATLQGLSQSAQRRRSCAPSRQVRRRAVGLRGYMEMKLKVTLKKSTIACLDNQIKTVKALGLHKIHQTVVHDDNPMIRGMIFKVKHMVDVEEVQE